MAFNRCDAGSVGCRLRVLATSDRSASLEVSRFIRRAIKLLVRSHPTISSNLANSAMSMRARVRSSSRTLPISCIVWTRAKISCVVSITRCLGRTLPPGGASPLPSASTWRDFPGADTSVGGMPLFPRTSPPDVVLLAWPHAAVGVCLVSRGGRGLRLCSSGRWTVA